MVYTQERKKILGSLVKEIDEFDLYYEMSDSISVWNRGHNAHTKIKLKLLDLIPSEKKYIETKLSSNGKFCWTRYFNKK